MNLPAKTVTYIEEDIGQVLQWLKSHRGILYRLEDSKALKDRIYEFYHSHAASLVKEETEIFRRKLLQVHSNLRRIPELRFIERPEWFRYYTFDPRNKAALDSCVLRIYLNPKAEHLDLIVDL